MHSHFGCICLTFPHCVFSNEPSNSVHGRMQSHIGCICLTLLHCVFWDVYSSCFSPRMHTCIGCIYLIFLLHYLSFSKEYLHWPHFHKTHHLKDFDPWQPNIVPCYCQFQTEKGLLIRREVKWKWESQLKGFKIISLDKTSVLTRPIFANFLKNLLIRKWKWYISLKWSWKWKISNSHSPLQHTHSTMKTTTEDNS